MDRASSRRRARRPAAPLASPLGSTWRASRVAQATLHAASVATAARAETATTALHPVFVEIPEMPRSEELHRRFSAAIARLRVGPVEVADAPTPPPAKAPGLLQTAKAALEKLKFAEAEAAADAAIAEARSTGGLGLAPQQLAELFLVQAMAAGRADWKELPAPPPALPPGKARDAYLQAAVLAPDRVLEPRRYPPIAIASFRLAAAEVKARGRGAILVKAPTSALASVDGAEPKPGLVSVPELPFGEHFVRVEEPGRKPWAQAVPLTDLTLEIDVPSQAPLVLDDATAVAAARRRGAASALLATPKPGRPLGLELALVDAASGARRNATTVPALEDPAALDAALMRLDEEARKAFVVARAAPGGVAQAPSSDARRGPGDEAARVDPAGAGSEGGGGGDGGGRRLTLTTIEEGPPRGPSFERDPAGWARARWPLLTAVGVAIGAAIALGVAANP